MNNFTVWVLEQSSYGDVISVTYFATEELLLAAKLKTEKIFAENHIDGIYFDIDEIEVYTE